MSDSPIPSPPAGDLDPEPARLEREPEERWSIRPWHWAMTGILVGYPLSVGPVVWLSRTFDPGHSWDRYLVWIYSPLEYLHRNVSVVNSFYDWYLPLFVER